MEALFDNRREYAESTVHTLLENDDLPLFIRCRANMVLGCSDKTGFLGYAEEALRIARLSHDRANNNPSELAKIMLDDCQKVYDDAKKADAAGVGVRRRDSEDIGELVWHYSQDAAKDTKLPEQSGATEPNLEASKTAATQPEGLTRQTKGVGRHKTDEKKILPQASSPPPVGRRQRGSTVGNEDQEMGRVTGGESPEAAGSGDEKPTADEDDEMQY
ncbi:hypothetical protein EJ03DRAFT_326291 [Teratosphaeria nubilosa]|uniref:Uncharacterized protein n=1 Tax=Teratosphaeria nubilosa TaxID=161662 RepID=A0A6G1LCT9_9PEZI|nr:hypothetical protein EJ03DRAFT_326291 [Teratosphaeria nubilosa]